MMSRGLLSAGLGAGAATVYLKPEIVQDWAKELAFGPRTLHPSLEPVGRELEHLQRLVEDLSRQVAVSRQQGVTVVHTGGERGGGSYLLYGAAVAGLGAAVYLRVLRGWTFGDMLYATRRGLRDGIGQVSQGLEALSAKVMEVRARLQERIAEVVRRQEELMGAQAEMAGQLAGVGRDVEHTRGQVGQVHAVVMDLEASMAEVGANQRHANHGIYVLCKAVSELMAGSNIPSKTELIEYTQQHPVWASASERLQGLEGLLGGDGGGGLRRVSSGARSRDENASPERRSPFLLPVAGGGAGGGGGGAEAALQQGRKALLDSAVLPSAGTGGNGAIGGVHHNHQQAAFAVSFPRSPPAVPVGGAGGQGPLDGSW